MGIDEAFENLHQTLRTMGRVAVAYREEWTARFSVVCRTICWETMPLR